MSKRKSTKMPVKLKDPAYLDHGELLYLMHELSRLIGTYFDNAMERHNLTHSQLWALMHISENAGQSQSELARPARPIEEISGFVAQPLFPRDQQLELAGKSARFRWTTNFRCSAYEYRLSAQGSLHFSLNAGLKPWDHAAGVLINQLAGGHASLLDGQDYRPDQNKGYLLLGPDQESWQTLSAVFKR